MTSSAPPVSIGLPVRNAERRVAGVVRSVLAQDHEDLELIITDNASTDATEDVCRELARADARVRYHRQPENVGLLNNFVHAITVARGTYFRWIGDDDRLEPAFVSRCLAEFAADPRLILVTTRVSYSTGDGATEAGEYTGTDLRSADPVVRLTEMLRLLTESYSTIDPLYGMVRREPVVALPRRNMLREDEVFACKLAVAGPWGHVPEILAHRHWKQEPIGVVARRLDVPAWQSHFSNTLQAREVARWLRETDLPLTAEQRRQAQAAVYRMYLRRQQGIVARRGRKLLRMVTPG